MTGTQGGHRGWVTLFSIFLLLGMIPLIPLLFWSFSTGWSWPHLWPESCGLRAWQALFTGGSGVGESVWNSLFIALVVTAVNLFLALPAAVALTRNSFTGKWFVEGMFFAPLIIPPFVSMMGMYLILLRLNLTDSMGGVILIHLVPTFPYMLRPLIVSLRTLGNAWENQARMLGAGILKRWRHVIIPFILPGILTGAGLSVLVSLSQYLLTLLVGGGQVKTLTILLFPFMNGGDLAIGAALSFLFAGVALVVLWLMESLFARYYGQKGPIHL